MRSLRKTRIFAAANFWKFSPLILLVKWLQSIVINNETAYPLFSHGCAFSVRHSDKEKFRMQTSHCPIYRLRTWGILLTLNFRLYTCMFTSICSLTLISYSKLFYFRIVQLEFLSILIELFAVFVQVYILTLKVHRINYFFIKTKFKSRF